MSDFEIENIVLGTLKLVTIPIASATGGTIDSAPPTLYLAMEQRKKSQLLTREAWGAAYVSSKEDLSDRYPVDRISFQITMPSAGNTRNEIDSQTNYNNSAVTARVSYTGTDGFGDFECLWVASASHAGYGDFNPLVSRW